jgi:hypothetical protein
MGIKYLNSFLKGKGVFKAGKRMSLATFLIENPSSVIAVDLLACYYNQLVKSIESDSLGEFAEHIANRFRLGSDQIMFCLDGPRNAEKEHGHRIRDGRVAESLNSLEHLVSIPERSRSRSWFKRGRKLLNKSFIMTMENKEAIRNAFQEKGLMCYVLEGEVDVVAPSTWLVLTKDTDFWIHSQQVVILQQIGESLSVDVYEQSKTLQILDMSLCAFRVLAIVSGNDYAPNVPNLAVKSNYDIL